jgi:uncharacterized tellurite resistance protein B-like protein
MNVWLARSLWTIGGAIIGFTIADSGREEEREKGKAEGFKDGQKEGERAAIERFNKIMQDTRKRDDYLVALVALGYAAAGCDGEISKSEKDELAHYLDSTFNLGGLPLALKKEIIKIKEKLAGAGTCLDRFEDIVDKLDRIAVVDLPEFTKVVQNIIDADGTSMPQETVFITKWKSYCDCRTGKEQRAQQFDEGPESLWDEMQELRQT